MSIKNGPVLDIIPLRFMLQIFHTNDNLFKVIILTFSTRNILHFGPYHLLDKNWILIWILLKNWNMSIMLKASAWNSPSCYVFLYTKTSFFFSFLHTGVGFDVLWFSVVFENEFLGFLSQSFFNTHPGKNVAKRRAHWFHSNCH